MIAGILLAAGYYLGYLHASKQLMVHFQSDALRDQIAAAVYSYYGDTPEQTSQAAPDQAAPDSEQTPSDHAQSEQVLPEQRLQTQESSKSSDADQTNPETDMVQLYEAQLIGFGSLKKAEDYRARLAELSIAARVRTRTHRVRRSNKHTAKKKIMWYQVITEPLPYHELLHVVEMLKKLDKLTDVVLTPLLIQAPPEQALPEQAQPEEEYTVQLP